MEGTEATVEARERRHTAFTTLRKSSVSTAQVTQVREIQTFKEKFLKKMCLAAQHENENGKMGKYRN